MKKRKFNSLSFFLTLRNLSNIQRLSAFGVSPYSVADHSLFTAIIAYYISLDYMRFKKRCTLDIAEVMKLAIFHDAPECLTGDLLYTTKKFMPRNALKEVEKSAFSVMTKDLDTYVKCRIESACLFDHSKNNDEARIVKFSDMAELGIFIHREIKNNIVFKETGIFERVLKLLRDSPTYKVSEFARCLVAELMDPNVQAVFV